MACAWISVGDRGGHGSVEGIGGRQVSLDGPDEEVGDVGAASIVAQAGLGGGLGVVVEVVELLRHGRWRRCAPDDHDGEKENARAEHDA